MRKYRFSSEPRPQPKPPAEPSASQIRPDAVSEADRGGLRQAIEELAAFHESHSEGRGLDLAEDDDFDRGWHGANRALAAELRTALAKNPAREVICTVREVQALPRGTVLLSERTTHRWVWAGQGSSPVVGGSGGGYTCASDFIEHEAPLRILAPDDMRSNFPSSTPCETATKKRPE